MLSPSIRDAIYSIYGFVRFADEIVDSFHGFNKEELINDFEKNIINHLKQG
jgi:phytoene/squalene synthetase